jgi:ketosteroid isomerase-like protein
MKRLFFVLFTGAIVFASCQPKPRVLPVDLTAEKVSVTKALDAHWEAVKAKDADAVMALLTDDVLSCGSDPEEFWNKTDLYNNIRQVFADTSLKTDITIDKREIRISKDGNSAIAFEQMVLKPFSHKLPVRTVYHLVKANNIWLFDFTSVGFIPKNEDIDRLNKALE